MVLGDLTMAAAFRVGYKELLWLLVYGIVCSEDEGRRTRWYESNGRPFLRRCFAWMRPPTNQPKNMRKKDARIIHLTMMPFCCVVSSTSCESQ